MIYKDVCGEKISALGMGTMRFPCIDGDSSKIDEKQSFEMMDLALFEGINYFDTAWGYHGGNSEPFVGRALSRHDRDKFMLATKFPGYDKANLSKVKEIFESQLERCKTDYFDFYLFHNVCEVNVDGYLDRSFGLYDYLVEQKKNGRIKHLGFSAHGSRLVIERFLDAYGENIEFCQLQINYIDWKFQKADSKVELLNERNIPVWVMEPLRGGKLATGQYEDEIKSIRDTQSIVEPAFRFLQSIPTVGVILSGMSDKEQIIQNVKIFSEHKPLNADEREKLLKIGERMVERIVVPCTSCRYCLNKCKKGLNIPKLFEVYNAHKYAGHETISKSALDEFEEGKRPYDCIGCKSCESVCPQLIKISDAMADFAACIK